MSGSEEDLIVPLPNRAKLNKVVDAPVKKSHSQARIRHDHVQPPNSSASTSSDSVTSSLLSNKASIESKNNGKAPVKASEAAKPTTKPADESSSATGDSVFSDPTKCLLIFICCIFGSMLFVWWIGGDTEMTIDHLDAQYMALGLDPSATDNEVKSAFKKMAMKYHPDKCRAESCAEEFAKIETAKKTILQWGTYFRARRVVGHR